jgi:hypothetical protein
MNHGIGAAGPSSGVTSLPPASASASLTTNLTNDNSDSMDGFKPASQGTQWLGDGWNFYNAPGNAGTATDDWEFLQNLMKGDINMDPYDSASGYGTFTPSGELQSNSYDLSPFQVQPPSNYEPLPTNQQPMPNGFGPVQAQFIPQQAMHPESTFLGHPQPSELLVELEPRQPQLAPQLTALKFPDGFIDRHLNEPLAAKKSMKPRKKNQKSQIDDETDEKGNLGTRNRKPTGSREVVPLTEKDSPSSSLPEWLVTANWYLREGINLTIWNDCLEAWIKFEKEIGFTEPASVS